MKSIKIFLILLYIFTLNTYPFAANAEKIVYINMEKIMQNSKAGKSVIDKINKEKKTDIKKFRKIEEDLKKEEEDLVNKRNVLSNEEFNKKLTSLRKKIEDYRSMTQKSIESSTKKRLNASADFAVQIKPILAEYAAENEIDIVIQKKNIIMGKSELDITDEVLKIVDKKITKLKLN